MRAHVASTRARENSYWTAMPKIARDDAKFGGFSREGADAQEVDIASFYTLHHANSQ